MKLTIIGWALGMENFTRFYIIFHILTLPPRALFRRRGLVKKIIFTTSFSILTNHLLLVSLIQQS
jgi:hypothetical protein